MSGDEKKNDEEEIRIEELLPDDPIELIKCAIKEAKKMNTPPPPITLRAMPTLKKRRLKICLMPSENLWMELSLDEHVLQVIVVDGKFYAVIESFVYEEMQDGTHEELRGFS